MVKKIALEEHFLSPGYEDYWRTTIGDVDPKILGGLLAKLTDFGDMRLEAMDRAGIARAVLAIAGPGVQSERDTATARRRAQRVERLSGARNPETARPLFRFRAPRHAGPRRRGRPNSNAACATSNSAAP